MNEKPFFVGYRKVPDGLRRFLWTVTVAVLFVAVGLSAAIGLSKTDPGAGQTRFDFGQQTVSGVLVTTPSPILYVTEGTDSIPEGHTLMLVGQGKNGVVERAREYDGQLVSVTGVLLDRGDLDMLQLVGGANEIEVAAADLGAPDIAPPEPLGRWRVAGEICDGKCESGAMRPGRGIAHRACASLCLIGGVPPIFVMAHPVEGAKFLMISGTEDNPMLPGLLDWVAVYVSLEGEITRHGDLLVLDVDIDSLERLP